jgi:predicted Rossmann-fold nucleotide-binding protein
VRISVFGGSSPKPGEAAYDQAYQLGKLIGEAGFTVLTGGYIGTMEAISRGTAEAGGKVVGVTCDQIEAWRPVAPRAITPRRLILIGPGWQAVVKQLIYQFKDYIPQPHRQLIEFAPDVTSAFQTLVSESEIW